eukprot:1158040-Pelagomonas_calceolata.AAC.8
MSFNMSWNLSIARYFPKCGAAPFLTAYHHVPHILSSVEKPRGPTRCIGTPVAAAVRHAFPACTSASISVCVGRTRVASCGCAACLCTSLCVWHDVGV